MTKAQLDLLLLVAKHLRFAVDSSQIAGKIAEALGIVEAEQNEVCLASLEAYRATNTSCDFNSSLVTTLGERFSK